MKYLPLFCLLLFSISLKAQIFYKTPTGAKYHLANCRMVNNVSEKITLNVAIDKGLTACKICSPPSSERSNSSNLYNPQGQSETVQCKAHTKAGNRCKHKTKIANGFCFQHNPDK